MGFGHYRPASLWAFGTSSPRFENEMLFETLNMHQGNMTETAVELRLTRRILGLWQGKSIGLFAVTFEPVHNHIRFLQDLQLHIVVA